MFTLLWGQSGTAKTSLLATFVKGMHRATGKRARLYTAESAQMGPLEGLIAQGMLEVWAIENAKYPFERIRDATQGGWPEDPSDPQSLIIPAFHYQHLARCGRCETLVYQGEKAPATVQLSCPKCKTPVVVKVERKVNPANGIDKVNAVMFEGLTAFGELFMDRMSGLSAAGEKIGEDVAVKFKDGGESVAGVSRSAYGIAQRRVKMACQESRHLPVDYVLWTATKEIGEDEFKRVMICGPKLPGSAATPDVPRWFGPCLGTTKVPMKDEKSGKERLEYRLYLQSYYESWQKLDSLKGVEHICNSRVPPDQLEGVPEFRVYEAKNETLLWDVLHLIEEKQLASGKGTGVAAVPPVAAVAK